MNYSRSVIEFMWKSCFSEEVVVLDPRLIWNCNVPLSHYVVCNLVSQWNPLFFDLREDHYESLFPLPHGYQLFFPPWKNIFVVVSAIWTMDIWRIEWQAQSREWLPLSWEYRTLSRGRSSGYLLGALCEFEKSLGGIKYFNSFKGSISEV